METNTEMLHLPLLPEEPHFNLPPMGSVLLTAPLIATSEVHPAISPTVS